jgi:hypothetical protein
MTIVRIVLVVGLLGLLPMRSYGQQALGDGRALDHNLRVGSGGRNGGGQKTDYQSRNAIITGNVSGLSYFHGSVPYRAAGEFRVNVPSNQQFRFHAQSVQPSSQRSLPLGNRQRVYRSMSVPRSGDVATAQAGTNLLLGRDTTSGSGFDSDAAGPRFGTVHSPVGVSIGVIHESDGRLLQVSASPLLGMRVYDLSPQVIGRPLVPDQQGTTAAAGRSGADQSASEKLYRPGQIMPVRVEPLKRGGRIDRLTGQAARIEAHLTIPQPAIHSRPGVDVFHDILLRIDQDQAIDTGAPIEPTSSRDHSGTNAEPADSADADQPDTAADNRDE